nr:hypothetical protein [Tanacetum cinerariifolium]
MSPAYSSAFGSLFHISTTILRDATDRVLIDCGVSVRVRFRSFRVEPGALFKPLEDDERHQESRQDQPNQIILQQVGAIREMLSRMWVRDNRPMEACLDVAGRVRRVLGLGKSSPCG